MVSSAEQMRRSHGSVGSEQPDSRRPLEDTDPRRVRHQTHVALRGLELDEPEPVAGQSMRSRRRSKVVEHDKGRLERTANGRQKFWKDRFWKRRSSARAERRRVEEALREQP